ncbi:L-fuconolactonase [Paenibacillus sp. UNCCL117]|uniref:amidohydrolase family protein n=1 Tax=unclassified Paenibacillus TaxID=185978 RepID=UPI00089072A5|nr:MULTISPECIES: amidohydrolase family protein [unclassified Paenibacillus]SDD31390.1 L-fuconolactonase [Paenibacillus sp. cl123]SFW40127.1 L-fuconolactonase [Paenibacillus sp. UNCCL117]
MRIDAHQHYWQVARGDYGWLTPEQGVLYRDYGPDDLRPELLRQQIKRTIVVQAAPTVEETRYLLELCEREETLAGVVGWVDLEADGVEQVLDELAQSPYFKGVRPMLQDMEDDAYITRDRVVRSLELLAERGLALDILIRSRHLPYVLQMLERVPGLRAVIDHIAKPDIAGGEREPWLSGLEAAASHLNVYCKLSGMVTEADLANWTESDIRPYVTEVCRMFGPDRLMFGSDWPVCLLAASYEDVVRLIERTLPESWTSADRTAVFGGNAARFYRI